METYKKKLIIIFVFITIFYVFGFLSGKKISDKKVEKILKEFEQVEDKQEFFILKRTFTWLTPKLYKKVIEVSANKNVDPLLVFSIINAESKGKNVISKSNSNGTRDYGIMQVNSVHVDSNPKQLLDIALNLEKGIDYIKYCTKKSRKRYGIETVFIIARLYNQGANGNMEYYKNWSYVEKVCLYYYNARMEVSNLNNKK